MDTIKAYNLVDMSPLVMINFEHRFDRLKDSLSELKRVTGHDFSVGKDLHLVRPVTFESPGVFDNVGIRSCLHSHLKAAQWAQSEALEHVVILEDDIYFAKLWPNFGSELLTKAIGVDADLVTLGYHDFFGEAPKLGSTPDLVEFSGRVHGGHCYVLKSAFYSRWIDYLELIASGVSTEQHKGPMGPDGAMNSVVAALPGVRRLIATTSVVDVRPNVSDITPHPIHRNPVVSALIQRYCRMKYRLSVLNRPG